VERPEGIEGVERQEEAVAEGRQGLDQELGPDERMPDAGAEADADVVDQRVTRAYAIARSGRLLATDRSQQDRGSQEGQRVEDNRQGRRDGLDQDPAQSRPDDLGDGLGGLELRVPLDEAVLADERRQVGVVRDLEQCGRRAAEAGHEVELRHAQSPQPGRQRHGQQQAGADQVGPDQQGPLGLPVDSPAHRQPDEHARRHADRREHGDLVGTRADRQHGQDRQGRPRDPAAQGADRLGRPEPEEVGLEPQPARSPGRPSPRFSLFHQRATSDPGTGSMGR
jgi:hypothetical protein